MLFESTEIRGLVLKNRFVRSATWEGLANDDGSCTSRLIDLMTELAIGGVGLIISGHAYVSREGQASLRQLGIYDDILLPDLIEMADAVHREGGKIAIQLAHGGCHGANKITGLETRGPSVPDETRGFSCREMSEDDIAETVLSFGRAALRAKNAGFDAVQIHAAHGYLLSQFLSPFYNRRTDTYGGCLENRARIVLEVMNAIRQAVGKDYPVMIKINSQDYLEDGLTVDEMVKVCMLLEDAGIDAVEISGGTVNEGSRYKASRTLTLELQEDEVYYREAAAQYKKKVHVPLILVGGIRSFSVADNLVRNGIADYIALSRPFIREPFLVNRWRSGDLRTATCISCNACFRPARQGEGLHCVVEECIKNKLMKRDY